MAWNDDVGSWRGWERERGKSEKPAEETAGPRKPGMQRGAGNLEKCEGVGESEGVVER